MSASKESYHGMLIGGSLAVGTLISACILNENKWHPVVANILNFGNWIAGFASLHGYWAALLTSSVLGGLVLMCVVLGVAPYLEEKVALAGKERARRALQEKEGMTVEQERDALIARFGQSKPS
ncbi:MAG: hypothetical protein IAE94_05315 [Chthoniobacterales bacterium]|nr:hypothetical protein [Chthoniobacterales bacterium]